MVRSHDADLGAIVLLGSVGGESLEREIRAGRRTPQEYEQE